MNKLKSFLKKEPVLSIAAVLAAASAFLVPPSAGYLAYIDFRVLALLFCLMAVVAGFIEVGFFDFISAKLLGKTAFTKEEEDIPFISGHSVSEHLQYMIDKYAPGASLMLARDYYFDIVNYEMNEILHGRGKQDAFTPAPNLKEFLTTVKSEGIKIGLVTSGLYEKAMPEILSTFKQLDMGDPVAFYDAIITAGQTFRKDQTGTLGELAPKPHPWLYAETARVGLGMPFERRHKVLGIEDSAAGVVSVKLAGFSCAGVAGGNIDAAGMSDLCDYRVDGLMDLLNIII